MKIHSSLGSKESVDDEMVERRQEEVKVVFAVGPDFERRHVEVILPISCSHLHFHAEFKSIHSCDETVNRVIFLLNPSALGGNFVESLNNLLFDLQNASSLNPRLFHVFHIYCLINSYKNFTHC